MRRQVVGLALGLCGCGAAPAVIETAQVDVCGGDLLPGSESVANMSQPDPEAHLRTIEGPAWASCVGASLVVAIHGSPEQVVRLLRAVRRHALQQPFSNGMPRLLVGGVMMVGHNLHFADPEFAGIVAPALADAARLNHWFAESDPTAVNDPTTAHDAATAAIAALGFLGRPESLAILKSMQESPTLRADYKSGLIRFQLLDAVECAERQIARRKPGTLPVRPDADSSSDRH